MASVEQVALTVSTVDDPSLQALTFRTWTLGILSCIVLPVVNQYFYYRVEQLSVDSTFVQIVAFPLGRLMAATLPTGFLNPGPFNVKEHVLITQFGSAGATSVYLLEAITIIKAFYKRPVPHVMILICFTAQILGFGFAGMFRKLLVETEEMWYPGVVSQVSLFRAFHEPEKRPKGGITKFQFFVIVMIVSAAYSVLPSYLFKTLSTVSIGSGTLGYGIGAFTFDWDTVVSRLGSPMVVPFWVIANTGLGFILVVYVVIPLCYWKFDIVSVRKYPIFSSGFFDSDGHRYNIKRVLNPDYTLNINEYNSYGTLNLGTAYFLNYGFLFASISSSIVYIFLTYHRQIFKRMKHECDDIHNVLMRKYKIVPMWWFIAVFIVSFIPSIAITLSYGDSLQLKWWGVLLAVILVPLMVLVNGTLQAIANNVISFGVLCEYMFGYLYPHRPFASVLFKAYSSLTADVATDMLSSFKLGHYMKIPPRSMFIVQLVSTLVATASYVGTGWWLLYTVPNICDENNLPDNSPWTCPSDRFLFTSSVIWGLIGPQRVFGNLGRYTVLNWGFLIGPLLTILVWFLQKSYPKVAWLQYLCVPIIFGRVCSMPYAQPIHFWSWLFVGTFFGYWLFFYKREWWQRYNYLFSAGLVCGMTFMTLILTANTHTQSISWWGSKNDYSVCHLASCSTEPGMSSTAGCPRL